MYNLAFQLWVTSCTLFRFTLFVFIIKLVLVGILKYSCVIVVIGVNWVKRYSRWC